ncbi:MAG: chemotaxis protein CheB [Lachnospiraceae bacterium]|nr:chemotaxis protein CheB [Lachnospiraceae bacterium]
MAYMKKLVVIAISTGGPKALHKLIPMLDKNLDAPIVIVQHMPKGFTASLAERLDETSEIAVSEVKDGEVLQKSHVYLAKGGKHLELAEDKMGRLIFKENDRPPINGLRPCANITFKSLKDITTDFILCVVLTGMGADGYEGIKELIGKQNIYTIAQDKETSVIYGMPKVIVDHGMADEVLPLDKISEGIRKKVGVR